MLRSTILNRLRDRIGSPRVNYSNDNWATSSAATDPQHPETLLLEDLWQAMKEVAADSRGKWERRKIRLLQNQWEYPLPSDCMCVWSVIYNFYGRWDVLDYLYHEEYWLHFSENILGSPPNYFTVQQGTSNPVHYTGTITTANADHPPILIDANANFGVTLTGEDINPGDKIFNITDDSSGYVRYLSAGTWKVTSVASEVTATTLTDPAGGFVANNVAIGDIILVETGTPSTGEEKNWGVINAVNSNLVVTYNRAYGTNDSLAGATTGYTIGTSDRIYLDHSGLVKDTEEGLVGGAEGDFDEDDSYQVEDYYSTLDTLFLSEAPSTSDTLGTESLLLIYMPYPKQPLKHFHPVEMSEAYAPAIIAKMHEFAKARERGEEPQYEWLLDKGIGQRKLYNQGRLGHKRRPQRRYAGRYVSWQDASLVDHRGI